MSWMYFSLDEMKCRCCGECKMDEHFMGMLDALRRAVKRPMPVVSGYRCPKHDAEEGGAGNHSQGLAVDIACSDSNLRFLIVYYAIHLGFKRVGIAKTFIHLDMCGDDHNKPTQVLWLY